VGLFGPLSGDVFTNSIVHFAQGAADENMLIPGMKVASILAIPLTVRADVTG
jgi:hypothetical protein